jgi:hypothetical protein
MNNLSKLQSEAVKEFNRLEMDDGDGCAVCLGEMMSLVNLKLLKDFLTDQIQKAYSKGREEVIKEKDIAEKFLYSNLPLDLSIGTEFEVGGRYEDWGFVVNYKGNKISEGGTLEQAINNAKTKLSIKSKGR